MIASTSCGVTGVPLGRRHLDDPAVNEQALPPAVLLDQVLAEFLRVIRTLP